MFYYPTLFIMNVNYTQITFTPHWYVQVNIYGLKWKYTCNIPIWLLVLYFSLFLDTEGVKFINMCFSRNPFQLTHIVRIRSMSMLMLLLFCLCQIAFVWSRGETRTVRAKNSRHITNWQMGNFWINSKEKKFKIFFCSFQERVKFYGFPVNQ